MNVETGADAALFPGKEYIIGIAVAVWQIRVARGKIPEVIHVSENKVKLTAKLYIQYCSTVNRDYSTRNEDWSTGNSF